MDLEKVIEPTNSTNPFVVCDEFVNDSKNAYIINKTWKDKFLESLKKMDECVRKVNNNETVDNFDYSIIEKCLNYLTSLSVEKPESPELSYFINNYIHLAHNINENTLKNETIRKKISYIKRYADRCLTYAEALGLMRKCSLRLTRFKDLKLPPYRLSQHYYTIIKEG